MKMTNEMWKEVEQRIGMKIYLPNELETMENNSSTFYKLNGIWYGGYSSTNVYVIKDLDELVEECKRIIDSAEKIHHGHYLLIAEKHPHVWWITRGDRVLRWTDPTMLMYKCPKCPAYCDRLRANKNGVSRTINKLPTKTPA